MTVRELCGDNEGNCITVAELCGDNEGECMTVGKLSPPRWPCG